MHLFPALDSIRSSIRLRARSLPFGLAIASLSVSARAEVIEPNGVRVPRTSADSTETSLQAYFDAEGEAIDASGEASENPGVFSPLCNFTATLVMSEAGAAAGLAWYNVPVDPNVAPAEIFQILPESANALNAVVNAADIRASADYEGGYIGFALTKFGGQAVYYSEYQRNVNCIRCAMPGFWKMMLAYRSDVHQSSYYIAFEDWEGANEDEWFGNDGDFNDKVFLVTGVSCPGGGEPCDTGKKGACAVGLTECSFSGEPECKQQYPERDEVCDNIDNDCDGAVDDGDLCPTGQVCSQGSCVRNCSTGEFQCPTGFACSDEGFCIEAACVDVDCGPGLACRAGECVGECQGVVCPIGQVCRLDRCVDPCAGVDCGEGTFCDRGVCVGDCTCNGCAGDLTCAGTGLCVAPGCEAVTCGDGQGCRDGSCVDACDGAVCPGAAECALGICSEPIPMSLGGAGGSGGAATGGISIGPIGGTNNPPPPAATGGSPSGAGGAPSNGENTQPGPAGVDRAQEESGCGCRLASNSGGSGYGAIALVALGMFGARRRFRVR